MTVRRYFISDIYTKVHLYDSQMILYVWQIHQEIGEQHLYESHTICYFKQIQLQIKRTAALRQSDNTLSRQIQLQIGNCLSVKTVVQRQGWRKSGIELHWELLHKTLVDNTTKQLYWTANTSCCQVVHSTAAGQIKLNQLKPSVNSIGSTRVNFMWFI